MELTGQCKDVFSQLQPSVVASCVLVDAFPQIQASVVASCVSGQVSSDTDQCSGQLMVQTGFALCFFVHRCMSALKLGYQQKSRTALNCWCQQQIRGRIDLPVSL